MPFSAGPNNYTKDNPAVKFSCFQKDKDGNLAVNKTTGLLTPCPIDTGDNAWMLTSGSACFDDDSWLVWQFSIAVFQDKRMQ